MKFIPNYRVCYGGRFYEAGAKLSIKDEDADMMKRHGTVLDEPTPPPATQKKQGRPRRGGNGQSGEDETSDWRV
nr:MAG TPA: hypothetical protein [Caudoviricetes sp.]